MADVAKAGGGTWRTVSMRPTAAGLTAGEKFDRFKLEAMTEVVLRIAGILMVMGSILLWFLLPLDEATGRVVTHSALASFMAAAGLGVFAYGTRGFRRQLSLDIEKGTLSLTKININDQARMSRTIDLGEIESVFLRRPEMRDGLATLLVRVHGTSAPAIALSGSMNEIETVHRQLCDVIRLSKGDEAEANPSLRLRRERPKPRLFAQA